MTAAEEERELIAEDSGRVKAAFFVRLWRFLTAFFVFFVLLQLFSVFAQAALPEIPANGLDDDGSGGDALFSGSDADNDGYTSAQECDDSDFTVVVGEYYPCDAGGGANTGYRLCGAGSWGSCTSNATPLCESSGGGSCYYIDFVSGNDTTGDGSYATPWKTLRCVGYFASGAPSCNIDPAPGSTIYLKGSGTYTDTYSTGLGLAVVSLDSTRSGSAGNPVTIKRYPGASVVIAGAGSDPTEGKVFWGDGADYITIEDIEITGGYGNGIHFVGGSDHVHVLRSSISEVEGQNNNNNSGIYLNGGTFSVSKWNTIIDISDPSEAGGDFSNTTGIVIFNDVTGGDHTIAYNRIGWTAACDAGGAVHGGAIKFKHGADKDSHGGNLVYGNLIWQACEFAFGIFTGGVEVYNNLVVDSEWGFQMTEDADSYFQGWNFHHNTFYRTLYGFNVNGEDTAFEHPVESWNYNHNVHLEAASYAGDIAGFRLDYYGNDTQRSEVLAILTLENNCYWNTATSGYKWSEFGASSDGHGAPAGPSGTSTTSLATWQAVQAGFDANSYVENPTLDSSFRATSTNCADKGWRLTPTPTPTPDGTRRLSSIFLRSSQ